MQNAKKEIRVTVNHERFISNPFSLKDPLQRYGALQVGKEGYMYEDLPYVGPAFPFKDDDPDELRTTSSTRAEV